MTEVDWMLVNGLMLAVVAYLTGRIHGALKVMKAHNLVTPKPNFGTKQ